MRFDCSARKSDLSTVTGFLSGESFELEFEFEKLTSGQSGIDVTFHLVDEMGILVFVGSTVYKCGNPLFEACVVRRLAFRLT